MKDTMCGLVKEVNAPSGLVYHTDLPIPEINDDEVLIKVHCSAICGTDLHIMEWDEWSQKRIKAPVTVGHETAGEIVAVGDDYGAESPAETPASAPVSAERPAAAGSLAPDTPPAVSADDAATPAAEASQAGIPDTETPARRRNRAVVKIDEAAGVPSGAESPADGAPGAARRPVRKPRRKKEEPEHKELFAFYEQSLF